MAPFGEAGYQGNDAKLDVEIQARWRLLLNRCKADAVGYVKAKKGGEFANESDRLQRAG